MDVLNRIGSRLLDGPRALRPWLIASLVCNMGIIVTGAVVRLTASGLGCSTWPRCTEESYVPHEASGIHGIIEFGNRTLTFVLMLAALGAFISAWRNTGLRSKLWWLTFVIGVGIPFQGVIGGITVLTSLNPYVVNLHLLLSVALIVLCVWALQLTSAAPAEAVSGKRRAVVVATFAACMLSIWVGTLVTGAGPHAGDERAVRNGLDIATIARVHSMSAWLVVVLTLACVWVLRESVRLRRISLILLATVLLQGVIGYLQYFLGVPAGIVALHMVGLTLLTAATAWLLVSTAGQQESTEPPFSWQQ